MFRNCNLNMAVVSRRGFRQSRSNFETKKMGTTTMSYEEIRATHHRARKEYKCEWCNELIKVGEKYLSRAYKFDGDFNSGQMHLECEDAMNRSRYDLISEGFYPGECTRGMAMT